MSVHDGQKQKEHLEQLGTIIRAFSSREEELDRTGAFPYENMKELQDSGYTAFTLPKKYGGAGGGLSDFLKGQEQIAAESGATALALGWHLGCVMEIVEKEDWEPEVLQEFYKRVAEGALVNRAATEPKTGSPTRGGRPETAAVKKEGVWEITGRKTFTTLAPVLDLFIVNAWMPEQEEMGWFLIDRNTDGLRIEETWDMAAMQGTGSHDLILDYVKIEEKYLVETAARSKSPAPWLLHIPACYLGIAAAARNEAVEFARTYTPNSLTGPIAELPNVQRLIGEIEANLLEARYFLYGAAERWENRPEERPETAKSFGAVKRSVTNKAIGIVDKAMRVIGAKSLQRVNPLQRHYRNVRAGLHNPPMDDMVITQLAREALFNK